MHRLPDLATTHPVNVLNNNQQLTLKLNFQWSTPVKHPLYARSCTYLDLITACISMTATEFPFCAPHGTPAQLTENNTEASSWPT
jgi:hypothetical protein